MKIRLVLAITFILFSITSGIEVFGMKEKNSYDFNSFDENNENNIENNVHSDYIQSPPAYPKNNNIKNKLFSGELQKNKDINTNEEGQEKNNNIFNENKDHNHKENLMNNVNNSFFEIDTSSKKDDKYNEAGDNNILYSNNNFYSFNKIPNKDLKDINLNINRKSFSKLGNNRSNSNNSFELDNRKNLNINVLSSDDMTNKNMNKSYEHINIKDLGLDGKYINITQPFGKNQSQNEVFLYLFKRVGCIYEGTLGITLSEIIASFGISILNNIFGFEEMVENKFYASMFLLKFGFKLGIPNLSFIIVDFNICIYNWLVSGIKYLMFFYNKAPLKQLGIEWKAKSFDTIFKFICLFNAFNIDIKLNIFGLSLCIPLTKILEALLIYKLIQKVDYKKKIELSITPIEETGKIYQAIYYTVKKKYKEAEGIMNKITEASEEGLKILEEISTQAKNILLPDNNPNNNNPNNNNEDNNNDNNDEEN